MFTGAFFHPLAKITSLWVKPCGALTDALRGRVQVVPSREVETLRKQTQDLTERRGLGASTSWLVK